MLKIICRVVFFISALYYLFVADPPSEHFVSQRGLRFAQANITNFSLYAVVSRLKSYKFSVSKESPVFTGTVSAYPDVNVTVPTKSLLSVEDFTFTMKVREISLKTIKYTLRVYSF